ncbi:MAG: SLATT domain-containing protein [Kineosporiaceae bacterium]|nr:SLATT domain-containing protein [Kineosporiaceae bacterium]
MSTRDEDFRQLYRTERIANQLAWYRARSTEYRTAHDQAILLRNGLLWVAAICGVLGAAPVGPAARTALGLTAALLAALATVIAGFDTLIDFDTVRKLYDDAAGNLDQADIDWDGASSTDLPELIDRVEDVLETENGRWGQLLRASATASAAAAAAATEREGTGSPEP